MQHQQNRTNTHKSGWTKGQSRFSQVPSVDIPRSVFNRSGGVKSAFDAGYLVPFFVDETLPGDTFSMRANIFGRMSTPIFPVMDNFYMDTFFFFVPNRLLWNNWERFNGAQDNPADSTDFLVPTMTETVGQLSLSDYFGIPVNAELTFNSLFHRAYNLIYNDWFRDENLQDSLVVDLDDGPDDPADYVLVRRGKRHDYFTSCLPFAQKGTAVGLPLGESADLQGTGTVEADGTPTFDIVGGGGIFNLQHQGPDENVELSGDPSTSNAALAWEDPALSLDLSGVTVDLSSATAATINEIRQAFQIQRLLERDARGGTRYTEVIRSHFGVVSPDMRLQRPEYLGGGSSRINTQVIPNNNVSESNSRHAELSGFSTVSDRASWTKSFTEHGVIIGMVNVRADLTYQQGLERMFSRQTRFDYYWPALSHLGEQSVLSKELYAQGVAADDDVFGYQERYAEYRYKPSRVTGTMRSTHATPLDAWHLGLDFADRPLLNALFIEDDPPFDRVVAVPSEPHFIFDSYLEYRCARPMPTYSVPGMIDHF